MPHIDNNRLLLHIGLSKTGTSSLQAFLNCNRETLEKKYGIYYPDLVRMKSDEYGGYGFLPEGVKNGRAFVHGKSSLCPGGDEWIFVCKKLNDYLNKGDVIVSNEGFTTHLDLGIFLSHLSKDIKNVFVIVYLRRQDQHIESWYKQMVKVTDRSEERTFDDYVREEDIPFYYYGTFLDKIADVVGKDHLIIRLFERDQLYGNCIEKDFLNAIGLDAGEEEWIFPSPVNESLDENLTDIKRTVNYIAKRRYDLQGADWRQWTFSEKNISFCGYMKRELGSKSQRCFFNLDSRTSFMKKYEEENRYVAEKYFKREDGELFHNPLGSSPTAEIQRISDEYIQEIVFAFSAIFFDMSERNTALESKLQRMKEKKYMEKARGRKIVLFGAGHNGRDFLCRTHLKIDNVIDNDKNKHGSKIEGRIIQGAEILKIKSCFVVVAVKNADQICRQIETMGFLRDYDYVLDDDY